jgi:hypothetical protein
VLKSHVACENLTLRAEITLECFKIILLRVQIILGRFENHTMRAKYTLVRVEITLGRVFCVSFTRLRAGVYWPYNVVGKIPRGPSSNFVLAVIFFFLGAT